MSSHEYIQKKNSQQSTPPTTTNTFTSRPFAPEVENAAPTEPISVEQIQAAQQFGYKAVSLKTFVPSSIVEASPKEEAEIEIESPKLHSNTPSETPPEISPQVPRIQRQPDEEKASARSEKIAEKPRENIQAKVEITENKPVPEITNSTETIPPKIRKSPRKVTPNSSQNRPPQINRQNFAIIPKTIQPKIANWDELNLSGSNQSLTNKNPYVQRLTLTNSPDIGKPKSADLTQIIGRDSGLNKNPIQRQTEDKSAEKSPVGQEIQTLFARQLQPQTLPSPPTPQPSLTPKNNPPPPGF